MVGGHRTAIYHVRSRVAEHSLERIDSPLVGTSPMVIPLRGD